MAIEDFARIKRLLEEQQHALQDIYRKLRDGGRISCVRNWRRDCFPRNYRALRRYLSDGTRGRIYFTGRARRRVYFACEGGCRQNTDQGDGDTQSFQVLHVVLLKLVIGVASFSKRTRRSVCRKPLSAFYAFSLRDMLRGARVYHPYRKADLT